MVSSMTIAFVPGDIATLLVEMRENPADVRFATACRVVTYDFGEPRQNGTGHKVWKILAR